MATRQIVIEIPEKVLLAEKVDENTFARELRVLAAVKLYEQGRLSSGRAAELSGMPRGAFLLELERYRVFPFEAELHDLEGDHACRHQQHIPLAPPVPWISEDVRLRVLTLAGERER